jgi:hypothetical protein
MFFENIPGREWNVFLQMYLEQLGNVFLQIYLEQLGNVFCQIFHVGLLGELVDCDIGLFRWEKGSMVLKKDGTQKMDVQYYKSFHILKCYISFHLKTFCHAKIRIDKEII